MENKELENLSNDIKNGVFTIEELFNCIKIFKPSVQKWIMKEYLAKQK
jgi:hypothetical protein